MPSVLVTTTESHTVRDDIVRETLSSEWTVETVDVGYSGGTPSQSLASVAVGHDSILLRPGSATRNLFETADSLEVLAVHGSGYTRVDRDAATENGVVVTHSPKATGAAVVEHTIGSMISLLREFPSVDEETSSGIWNKGGNPGIELGRTTVGVVGLGTIGFDVAKKVQLFGAEVLGYDPYVSGDREDSDIYPRISRETVVDAGVKLVDLESLLERSDVLTLHPALTEETRNMIGTAELESMAGGYLVNVSRGGLVDEAALISVVRSGIIKGVALDVMSREPPRSDNPLLRSPDVFVTPHIAGVTAGYLERGARLGAERIATVIDGNRPDTVVNPAVYDHR